MRELLPRPIAWIADAPIRIEGRATSAAAPDAVFAVLADHERWPEWFPNVRKVEVMGPATGVGARRRVHVPRVVVEEEFIVWDPGKRWAFTGTAARPRFVRSIVEDCRLEPTPDGGTSISYSMYLDPTGVYRPIVKASQGTIRKSIEQAVGQLAARAASG
jgi:hypothetical protein